MGQVDVKNGAASSVQSVPDGYLQMFVTDVGHNGVTVSNTPSERAKQATVVSLKKKRTWG